MRISDWSSDVCSSDLDRITRQHAILDAAVRLGTKTRILIDRICAIGQWRTQRTQLDRIGVGEEPDFDVVVIANIVDAAQRDQNAPRSRQHLGGVAIDRTSVVWGKSVLVRVDLGGRRIIKKKTNDTPTTKRRE